MTKIKILNEDLKNKIAAGEVIERPASVVKELLENSLDAGSTEIKIILKGGGNTSIIVQDNGIGLNKSDLILAFSRHSTSKISHLDDLFNINTLGFRGEALASIASVSKVRAISCENEDDIGNEITIINGNISNSKFSQLEKGTLISVSDLFFSIPARRKFLKSQKTEFKHIVSIIRRIALANQNVKFILEHDDKLIFSLNQDNLKNRICSLYNKSFLNDLIEINKKNEFLSLTGFVGNLNLVRKRVGEQNLFLNGRYIVSRLLNSAVYSSYKSLIGRGEFPFFVLNIEIPPDLVDVNVHPMKTEVRFHDEWRVYHFIKSTISDYLKNIMSTIPKLNINENINKTNDNHFQSSISFNNQNIKSNYLDKLDKAKEYVKEINNENITNINQSNENLKLEKIWQVHSKYIISQVNSGLILIDQHVAHERILYEKAIDAMMGSSLPSQTLLFPRLIEFSVNDFETVLEIYSHLEKLGFRMTKSKNNSLTIDGVPLELQWGEEKKVLNEIIDYYTNEKKIRSSFMDSLAASYACKAAIKAGDVLNDDEMHSLVDRLFATKNPYFCPHGRPIIINLSLEELDKRFERI